MKMISCKIHPSLLLLCLYLLSSHTVHASIRGDNKRQALTQGSYSKIPGYNCFRNLEGMTETMFDLEQTHPDLVSVSSIGKSYLNADINVMKITSASSSSPKGKVLLTSGVHAREYAPPELLMRFAESLLENYSKDPDTTWILDHTEIHIVFYVNPDGRLQAEQQSTKSWRKNVNPGTNSNCNSKSIGVDINRNFDFVWGDTSGASTWPCASDYMGTSAESEPETKALADYAKSLFPEEQRKSDPEGQINEPFGEEITGLYMDVHAYGGFTYYPWGHKDEKSPDNSSLEALGRKISSFNGYDLWAGGQDGFQYVVSGDSSDYMYAVLGVASFGLEIGNAFHESCNTFENDILPKNLPALKYVAKVAMRPNFLAKGPDVIELSANIVGNEVKVTAVASDCELVEMGGNSCFETGSQAVTGITLSLDVHPDDVTGDDTVVEMISSGNQFIGTISTSGISPGKHILYVQAKDSDDYLGPVSSIFITVNGSPSSPTPSPTSSDGWTEIVSEGFDTSFGDFTKGGPGVRRYDNALKKVGVVRVKRGFLSTRFNASSYSKVKVVLSAMFPRKADAICVEYKSDTTWEEIGCLRGEDYTLRSWHDDNGVEFDVDVPGQIAIRLKSSGNRRRVFLDQVSILGI